MSEMTYLKVPPLAELHEKLKTEFRSKLVAGLAKTGWSNTVTCQRFKWLFDELAEEFNAVGVQAKVKKNGTDSYHGWDITVSLPGKEIISEKLQETNGVSGNVKTQIHDKSAQSS